MLKRKTKRLQKHNNCESLRYQKNCDIIIVMTQAREEE